MSKAFLTSPASMSTCDILDWPADIAAKSKIWREGDLLRGKVAEPLAAARLRYRWCQRWTEGLTQLRRQFDGDLDQYLLLLIFEQGEMARALACLEGSLRKDRPARPEPRGMNAMSIADICGIPRETARRKLKRLIARQAITLGPDGLYYFVSRPDGLLSPDRPFCGIPPPPLLGTVGEEGRWILPAGDDL